LLSDLERTVGLPIDPEINANTVSGLFMHRLLTLPKTGDVLVEGDYTLKINAMRGRQPIEVIVEKRAKDGAGSVKDETPA